MQCAADILYNRSFMHENNFKHIHTLSENIACNMNCKHTLYTHTHTRHDDYLPTVCLSNKPSPENQGTCNQDRKYFFLLLHKQRRFCIHLQYH